MNDQNRFENLIWKITFFLTGMSILVTLWTISSKLETIIFLLKKGN